VVKVGVRGGWIRNSLQPARGFSTKEMEFTTTPEERAEAAKMRQGSGGKSGASDPGISQKKTSASASEEAVKSLILSQFPAVEIDADHKQKYVLIQVKADGLTNPIHLVRGRKLASYHKDVAGPTLEKIRMCTNVPGIRYSVRGGGRILHDSQRPAIEIYGYSYGFPWEGDKYRHDISAKLCEAAYPGYEIIHINDSSLGLY